MIAGHKNNSILRVTAGTPITLTCRADYGDPPFVLSWARETRPTDLNLTDETTLIKETVTINTYHKYGPGLSSYTTEENKEAQSNGPTSANIEPADSGYFTVGTTETPTENNQIIVNENLTNKRKYMTTTPAVGLVNAMTGIVHNTSETTIIPDTTYVATLADRTGTEYDNYLTNETVTTAYELGWIDDSNDVVNTKVPIGLRLSEKERVQMMKFLRGYR